MVKRLEQICRDVFGLAWTKKLAYWIITAAGTVAECAFLIASLWMSINSSVHGFVLLFMSEGMTINLSWLANTAFVGLPECVSLLAVVLTIGHIRLWWYNRKNWVSLVWSIAYGVPTLFFVVLSFFTIGFSVASVGFQMPEPLIIARALAGYTFGFVAYLHMQMGVPQEVDRLQKRDQSIEDLTSKINDLIQQSEEQKRDFAQQSEKQKQTSGQQIALLHRELEEQKRILAEHKTANKRLVEEMNKSSDDALEVYGDEFINWLKSGVKSADAETISRYTSLSTRKINNALERRELKVTPNNKGLILISSLVPWLRNMANSDRKTDVEIPALRIVGAQ